MKRFIITENERKNILKSHGILKEQDDSNLSATDMLDKIQSSLGTSNDVIIGPQTTKLIVSALQGTSSTSDFSCVTKYPNKQVVEYEDGKYGYKINNLIFDRSGNYWAENDLTTKYTYKCNGTTIQTSNHKDITSETKKDNTEEIKKFIAQLVGMEGDDEELKNALLKRNYSKEDIIKADPSLERLFGTTSTETKPETKVETKPQMLNGEMVADENNLFNSVFDKTGNIPPLNPLGSKP
jgi:hypothetical protein